jgi:hypothetical protein
MNAISYGLFASSRMRFSEQHMQSEYTYGLSVWLSLPTETRENQAALDFVSRLIALSS